MSFNPVLKHPLIKEFGLSTDIPPATAILRWAMHRNVVVIPSSANPDHIETNYFSHQMSVPSSMLGAVDSLDGTFTEDDADMSYEDFVKKFGMTEAEISQKLFPDLQEEESEEVAGGLPDDYTTSGKDEL